MPWAAEAPAEISDSPCSAPDPAVSCLRQPCNIWGSVEAASPGLVQASGGRGSPSLALMWVCFWACRKTWGPRFRVPWEPWPIPGLQAFCHLPGSLSGPGRSRPLHQRADQGQGLQLTGDTRQKAGKGVAGQVCCASLGAALCPCSRGTSLCPCAHLQPPHWLLCGGRLGAAGVGGLPAPRFHRNQ